MQACQAVVPWMSYKQSASLNGCSQSRIRCKAKLTNCNTGGNSAVS
jgi:hypothetical protein